MPYANDKECKCICELPFQVQARCMPTLTEEMVTVSLVNGNDLQLRVFSDASPKSFGAVAYLRYKISDNNFNTRFVISKSRVAPIKRITLPRLELMGAVIAARLVKHLRRIFKDFNRIILCSDSTIVLYWIKGSASKFKPFVSNRIAEIQENTDPVSWRHCSGKQNPADLLTRGITSRELINSEKCWHDPEWLKDSENLWPNLEGFESIVSETVELKSSLIVNLTITHEKIIDPDKYSSLLKLLRVTAYIFRFVNALRRKDFQKGPLASEELFKAEIFWVKVTQNDFYSSEITCIKSDKPLQKDSKLLCLNPFLVDSGVLRVTGRLGKTTSLSANEKHPIILPSKSMLSELLIWESHKRVFHSGVSHTLVQWNYIIERVAWWGGFYERMVRSVKVALRKALGKSSLTTEQLSTVLTEIEGMINSRPITYVGSETEEPIPLTPAHFIIGKRITSLPPVRLHLVCVCVIPISLPENA
ncbi:integrase catalytic domain-containing protein [Trichonephila clavata]|uniref:Integrase catalytic domain-containing protein n=1 Tax=Trichonephila clavata TaxID=2740835 RepID=A0A8X6F0B0_TRICU|nr:integrase catalytic domain-containing protein [Trichonephila clavata]